MENSTILLNLYPTILVTGGTGFVGKYIVNQLLREGYDVRLLVRLGTSIPTEWQNKVTVFQADVADPSTLHGCCQGVSAVIHLIGTIAERGDATFEKVHVDITRNLLAEAKKSGGRRWIHMSATGTRPHAVSRYHQTKWKSEELVRNSGLAWTIFRPSMIFGKEDRFVNLFAKLIKCPFGVLRGWILPYFGDGKSVIRPIAVEHVAQAFVRSLSNESAVGKTFSLSGQALTFPEMLESISSVFGYKSLTIHEDPDLAFYPWLKGFFQGRRPILISLPFWLAYGLGWFVEAFWMGIYQLIPASWARHLPEPMPTRDQIIMLNEDDCDCGKEAEEMFEFKSQPFEEAIKPQLKMN